tara:strand:+ start:6804 stop:6974 length:171 start_codon:yes stop_codon:yes gene_type:complete
MTLPLLIIAGLCSLWFAGEIQTNGEGLLTYATYALAAVFFARAVLEAIVIAGAGRK